jgi:AcrR family transcriptional regulator
MAGLARDSQRRRPRQERSRDLVDALLVATARVVAKDGPEGVTINAIVRTAGVSPGSAYQYFGSKDELLGALVERKAERDLHEIAGAMTGGSLEEVLRGSTRVMVALHRRDRALMQGLLALVAPTGRQLVVRAIARQGREGLRALLEAHRAELRPDLDPSLAAFVLGKAIEEVVHAALLEEPERIEDPRLADELFRLGWAYLQ